jgi:NodT family efflux transporter outer membrane factor (OMF) lipoprotein
MTSRALHLLAAAATLALLSACATGTAPAADAPRGTLPAAWQAPQPTPAAGAAADVLQGSAWWASFQAPELPGLIDAAQAASPTLAAAMARIERARATRTAAGAALLPQVDAVAGTQSGRSVPRQPTATSASLGLQAAWEIDLFGGGAAGRDAAQARLEAAQAGWHDARAAVAAEVASSFIAYRGCQAQAAQAALDAASREETARLTGLSAQAGFAAPADAALARAGAAQARSTLVARRAQCETLLKSLVELTGLAEADLRQRLSSGLGTGVTTVPQPAALAISLLPADLLRRRPDLAEAERAVLAAASDRRSAEARERPQLRLSGNLAAASFRSAGLSSNGATWSLGPLQLSLPVFDGGSSAANSAAARAEYEAAVATYQGQVRRAVREVEAALVALDASASRQRDAEAAARDFQAALQATQARQRSGLASLFDLEDARRLALQAQSALVELQTERASAWITLYRALGGGFVPDANTPAAATPAR